MPTAPTYGNRRVSAAPIPNQQVSPNAPAAAFGVATPSPATGALAIAADIVQQETIRADRLAITEAENERMAAESALQREVEERFRGKDALLAGAWFESKRRERLAPIEERLNGRQREVFRARAERAGIELQGRVESAAAQEYDRFEVQEYDKGITNRINAAIANPSQAPALLQEVRGMVATVARSRGLGPEQVAAMQGEAVSKLHTAVIGRLLSDGRDTEAQAYMTAHRDEFVGADRLRAEKEVEQVTTDAAAQRAVDQVWREQGPKLLTDPVKLADMEAWIRERYGDQPNVVKAARQELRARVQAHEDQEREVTASRKAAVLGAYNTGASLAEVKRMQEYRALAGDDQNQIATYISDRGHALSERARAQRERRNNAAYWGYSDPAKLARMSEAEVIALEPEVGAQGVTQLLTAHRSIAKGTQELRNATIDNDLFKDIAADAGLPAHTLPSRLSEEERASLTALRNNVEAAIAAAQLRDARPLRRDEKEAIMRGIVDQTVILKRFWGDRRAIASLVSEDDAGDAFIPMDAIPDAGVTAILNWMREQEIIPITTTDVQAREKYRDRIQRAAALERIGRPWAEREAVLRGRQ